MPNFSHYFLYQDNALQQRGNPANFHSNTKIKATATAYSHHLATFVQLNLVNLKNVKKIAQLLLLQLKKASIIRISDILRHKVYI